MVESLMYYRLRGFGNSVHGVIEVLYRHFPGGAEENCEKPQPG
jgi:hypothetical protein